ncbi:MULTISPECIES: ATP-binding cassette domain-containing protein [Streptococcus]|uniref:ATP-binding cassette domain-containing protein n=1 Tax=Streptococcus caledonicus TaxID=2614158 RepID=A0ABW0UD07_9STRE|nr:ATP-binding cassette domain-containing protein [Streptococcus sp. S784/96/1]
MKTILQVRNLTVQNEKGVLFEVPAFKIASGEKIGFVGENGIGKTTLFCQLFNQESSNIKRATSIGYLEQILPLNYLSGGQQERKQLEKFMFSDNELILLDEPTTNLDDENIEWLINVINASNKTFLIISHDRDFLDRTIDKIIFVENGQLQSFYGDYSEFQSWTVHKKEKQTIQYKQDIKKKKQLERALREKKEKSARLLKKKKGVSQSEWKMRSYVGDYESKAKSLAKSAKSIETRLLRETVTTQPHRLKQLTIKVPDMLLIKKGKSLLRINDNIYENSNNINLKIKNFNIKAGDKISLVGKNGSGKTQFLELIYSLKDLISKEDYISNNISIGYFKQSLNLFNKNDVLLKVLLMESEQPNQVVFDTLASLGFRNEEMKRRYEQLSGGQKVKANLAKILLGNYNVLFLDEPNNYLDIIAMQALENFLKAYDGTFILVTHDKRLRDSVCTREFIVDSLTINSQESLRF